MLNIWLNVGCLVFGLVAWLLPLINLGIENKTKNNHWKTLSIASLSACAISLCIQFVIDSNWDKSDWDHNYTPYIALTLFTVTIILNVITLFIYRKSNEKCEHSSFR